MGYAEISSLHSQRVDIRTIGHRTRIQFVCISYRREVKAVLRPAHMKDLYKRYLLLSEQDLIVREINLQGVQAGSVACSAERKERSPGDDLERIFAVDVD